MMGFGPPAQANTFESKHRAGDGDFIPRRVLASHPEAPHPALRATRSPPSRFGVDIATEAWLAALLSEAKDLLGRWHARTDRLAPRLASRFRAIRRSKRSFATLRMTPSGPSKMCPLHSAFV